MKLPWLRCWLLKPALWLLVVRLEDPTTESFIIKLFIILFSSPWRMQWLGTPVWFVFSEPNPVKFVRESAICSGCFSLCEFERVFAAGNLFVILVRIGLSPVGSALQRR